MVCPLIESKKDGSCLGTDRYSGHRKDGRKRVCSITSFNGRYDNIVTIPEDMKNSSGIIICPMNGDDGAVMISGDKSRFCY